MTNNLTTNRSRRMAPNKTDLTFADLDEQTALELPERELMNCGCGSLLGLNVGVGAAANISGLNAGAAIGASVSTSGINVGLGAAVTTGTYSCS
jgi:hypothetical protein